MNDKMLKRFESKNTDNKIYIFECKIKYSNLAYLSKLANRREISRSSLFEKMVLSILILNPSKKTIRVEQKNINGKNNKKHRKIYGDIPKLTLHPRYIEMIKAEKERRDVSYTIVIDEIFINYRSKYPL